MNRTMLLEIVMADLKKAIENYGQRQPEEYNLENRIVELKQALAKHAEIKQVTDEEIDEVFPIKPTLDTNFQLGSRNGAKWMRNLLTKKEEKK